MDFMALMLAKTFVPYMVRSSMNLKVKNSSIDSNRLAVVSELFKRVEDQL